MRVRLVELMGDHQHVHLAFVVARRLRRQPRRLDALDEPGNGLLVAERGGGRYHPQRRQCQCRLAAALPRIPSPLKPVFAL